MRKKILAANWKMNLSPSEAKSYGQKIPRLIKREWENQVYIFPQAIYLRDFQKTVSKTKVHVGAQNCHWEEKGAFTGELSPRTLLECGVDVVLVGHSERRHLFKETDDQITQKCKALLHLGMTPLLCVGETLEQRNRGLTNDSITRQLEPVLPLLKKKDSLIVAYEPVWAIGTGRVATPDQAQKAHEVLREVMERFRLEDTPILYGGSVNLENVTELNQCKDVDGFLVGGASLDPSTFAQICVATLNAKRQKA